MYFPLLLKWQNPILQSLDPKECFFIDDLEKNINAARSLGMDGIVFNGNIDDVKKAIGF